jgi:hypothetical protein
VLSGHRARSGAVGSEGLRSADEHVMVSAVAPALAWILLAASLVTGLAALVRMADPGAAVAHDLKGALRLAEGLTRTVVALFTLAAAVFLADLVRRLRSRRRGEGEAALVPEPPRVPAWLRALTQILSLAYFILLAYVLWSRGLPFVAMILGQGGASGLGPLLGEELPDAPPVVTWTFGILALAAGVGALALALWVALSDRLTEWWTATSRAAPRPPLAEAVAESLEDLRSEPDPRRAIIRCYARFERVAADSGLARKPWLTPMEFLRETLERLPLPRAAVQTLTGLFELARFSNRTLGEGERGRALRALDEIRSGVEEGRTDAVAG